MLSRHDLAKELRQLTADFELDLRARVVSDPSAAQLRVDYETARKHGLTSDTWQVWVDEQVSQAATGWILATVLIRFCEDNGLLDVPFASGEAESVDEEFFQQHPAATAADLIISTVNRLRAHPSMAQVFSRDSHPLWRLRPGHDACRTLLDFWRRRTPDGRLVHDFTDRTRSTELLGDLYGAICERAGRTYGSVATPSFVVNLIHDLTLDPALDAYISGQPGLSGFRMIDPACGTGTFLLTAVERLLRHWSESRPDMSRWQHAARALGSVHGCDIDPGAVSITRFRLLLAAMNSAGERRLDNVPDLPLVVATGDALLYGRDGGPAETGLTGYGSPTDIAGYAKRHGLLRPASYHAVTSNPPFITVKNKALFAAYRDSYESCNGPYALSVPFTELSFDLALRGEDAGRVGLLTSNSFMKREFGRNLIERVLPRVQISHVIDASGAYIPGHGTPVVILAGRNQVPDPDVPVHMVVGRQGEPRVPDVPSEGLVWQSLRRLVFEAGTEDVWAESYLQERGQLDTFPWSLASSAARAVLRLMESSGEQLQERVSRIGYAANTGSDDLFCSTARSFARSGAEESAIVHVLTGSEVRDWSAHAQLRAFFPRTGHGEEPADLDLLPRHRRRLWAYQAVLKRRPGMRKSAPWYDWHQFASDWDTHPWSIVFPWVATQPHFSLLRGSAVPLNSAPVIKLPPSATKATHLELLGILNSSTVSFWLKQMSQSKGQPHVGALRSGEAWEKIYEFTSTRLLDLPLPATLPNSPAAELDSLATELEQGLSHVAAPDVHPTIQSLDVAQRQWHDIRTRMVALQEELDWQVYACYGLIPDDGQLTAHRADVPPLQLGERAFEIVLARKVLAGEATTSWFKRHNATPVTELPKHWPPAYGDLVQRRVEVIERNMPIAMIERPEYKRSWSTGGWDKTVQSILRERLLDLCETPELWFNPTPAGLRPVARTIRKLAELLAENEEFMELAALSDTATESVEVLLLGLLADEHVPQAAPLRYKASGLAKLHRWEELWQAQWRREDSSRATAQRDPTGAAEHELNPPRFTPGDFTRLSYWKQRGKFDVPNERFTSFPTSVSTLSPTTLIGWAGWDARERMQAMLDLLETDAHAHAHRAESALPLLAAWVDVLPWISMTGRGIGPTLPSDDDGTWLHVYEEQLTRLGLTVEDVNSWRPPAPKRGRPRKGA
ncbi:BREX-2 system adenine-specific DNA-methyltransferase PglX [Streptomyces sp. ME02-8801-2C]|uniref:BREX-2 system adenine-specific DNA-methyltransferase PglX n=1 Tax=Streptomyces sp. ME02-8801-2C TaxID=3028680 RepID=UPI0029A89832|nr:BREX-2 system adenine-specific DNA-methyltransferase PglX [Streptomyces sp. ME02-8801-2C]MDX3455610.1 BREX-2 system adenine-specific DNA-methyltransferase PglX [Streptomyces sp. ME02-8801-2C]